LTLQLISRALASGLLYKLQINPFDSSDLLRLRYVLDGMNRDLCSQYSSRELLTSLVSKVCMAIGNRAQFKPANEDMIKILDYLRELDFPDRKRSRETSPENDDLIALWKQEFGDPEEFERQYEAKLAAAGVGESPEAQQVRIRQEHIRSFMRA